MSYKFDREKFKRKTKKKKQKDIEELTGISQPMISKFVNGKASIRVDQFLDICSYLDENPKAFFIKLNL